MKKVVLYILVLSAITAFPAYAEKSDATTVFKVNNNRGTWDGNKEKKGRQNVLNFLLSYDTKNFGILMTGGHGSTTFEYNSTTKAGFHLFSFLDSIVSSYYKTDAIPFFNARFGVDANLPTGQSALSDSDFNSLFLNTVTSDLNLISSFGTGYSLAPNMVLTHAFGDSVTLGLGTRYQFNGRYNPTLDVPDDDYDPGDELKIMSSMLYKVAKKTTLLLDLTASFTARDDQGGEEVFKMGNRYDLGLRWIQTYSKLRITSAFLYGLQDKNQNLGAGSMTTEERNSNNNNYELFVNTGIQLFPKLACSSIVGFKSILSNKYDPGDTLYDGGYNKTYLGINVIFNFTKKLILTSDVRIFRLNNNEDFLEENSVAYKGINADIGFIAFF